jgi:hypothetical protein
MSMGDTTELPLDIVKNVLVSKCQMISHSNCGCTPANSIQKGDHESYHRRSAHRPTSGEAGVAQYRSTGPRNFL